MDMDMDMDMGVWIWGMMSLASAGFPSLVLNETQRNDRFACVVAQAER